MTGLPRLVIAAVHSGAGKTTLTAGLIAAWRCRGLTVQPFKAGPDYIDPSYHTLAAGRPCRNLDAWMLPPNAVVASFARGSLGADLAVIEGVMGLFDGFSYHEESGSTAHLAKLLAAPVVLILNIRSLARSAAALAQGFARFDLDLPLAGFNFYYEDNLELLVEAGAELAFFSPLADAALPAGAAGLYIGGGFPELYAGRLAENTALRDELRAAIAAGLPTHAECGGLMYLTEAITDLDGRTHPMVGALPGRSAITGRLALGYRQATTLADTPLAPAGMTVRGHEFHYSDWIGRPASLPAAYRLTAAADQPERLEGFASPTLLASYIHLHWAANPELTARFVATCCGQEGGSSHDRNRNRWASK